MFDVGFSELLVICLVALVVLGPERLPRAARLAGLWLRRARASWYSLRSELERELADEELRRSLKDGARQLGEIRDELRQEARSIGHALPTAAEVGLAPQGGDPQAPTPAADTPAGSDRPGAAS